MLLWKLFVAFDVLINLGYWRAVIRGNEKLQGSDAIAIPIGLVGSVGLITYAFSYATLPETFWQVFLPIFFACSAWENTSAVNKDAVDTGTLVGAALAVLIVGFTAVAIYRLGGSAWIGTLGI